MSPRLPGRRWCKAISLRQLSALLFLADCPHGSFSWVDEIVRRPVEFHTASLRALRDKGLIVWTVEPESVWRRFTVDLSPAGQALVAAYRFGFESGLEA